MKRVHIPQIGEVKIVKSKKSKRIRITLKPFEGITLSLPYHISYSSGLSFLESKKGWVRATQERMKRIENQQVSFLEQGYLQTISGKIYIAHVSRKQELNLSAGDSVIWFNGEVQSIKEESKEAITHELIKQLRLRAKKYLPEKVRQLAFRHEFKYKEVRIKNVKTIWGSCSAKNNINLNLHLIRMPLPLIDYVILHELVHTEIKNHSQKFWNRLIHICPNALELRKELKKHNVFFT